MLRLLKKATIALGLIIAFLVVGGAVMYLLGIRINLDGGGGVHLGMRKSAEDQAREIAQHREAQRASPQAQAPASNPGSDPVKPAAPEAGASAAAAATVLNSVYWTDFRGPRRDGRYAERSLSLDWPSAGLKPVWKQPVGGGYASFVAARGRAFTIEQRGSEEVATAYDIVSGRELWTNAWKTTFRESMGGDGPRATPTWHAGKLYALGGAGELRAIDDASGRTLWRTNILEDAGATNLQWGMSASPLVVDDTIIVLPGGERGQSLVAYNASSGQRAWSALDDRASYASPMLVTLAGVRQLLVFTAARLAAVSPDRGELLWEFPWRTQYDVNASQPLILGDNRVFLSTGYGTGAAAIELTRNADGALSPREAWRTNRMKNQFTSSVLHDGHIYGLDEAILACLDANSGELKWKGGRYGYGQVMLTGGHLIVLTEGGEIALVKASPERHTEIVRFPVLDGKTWNHPAISDGFLLVRNASEMAAFDLRK